MKSIAVPVTRRAATKPRRAGHPQTAPDQVVGGGVAPARAPGPRHAAPEAHHSYVVGQRLRVLGGGPIWGRQGAFCHVVALMPHDSGPFLYRVRSEVENFERVVAEGDLTIPEMP